MFTHLISEFDDGVSFSYSPFPIHLDYDRTDWKVIPEHYSWLYWKTKFALFWSSHKSKLTKAIKYLTSPLVTALIFLGSVYLTLLDLAPLWIVVMSGVWLIHLLDRYDKNHQLRYWFIGISKSKNSLLSMSEMMGRMFRPIPLNALTLEVVVDANDRQRCTLTITNTSLFVVPFVSISARSISELVGFEYLNSLKTKEQSTNLTSNVDRLFKKLTRKWILPMQRVHWNIRLPEGWISLPIQQEVEAVVSISKRASGERTHGPRTFLLSVKSSHLG